MNINNMKMIAEHYGFNSQSRQLIEEMGELTSAINHHWRKDLQCGEKPFDKSNQSPEVKHMIEEIADVKLCLEQLIYLLDCTAKVDFLMDYKMSRQNFRIYGDKNEMPL